MTPVAEAIYGHQYAHNTIYDGRGGVVWQDDGGLWCRACQTAFPRDSSPLQGRPYDDFFEHVAEKVREAVTREQDDARGAVWCTRCTCYRAPGECDHVE